MQFKFLLCKDSFLYFHSLFQKMLYKIELKRCKCAFKKSILCTENFVQNMLFTNWFKFTVVIQNSKNHPKNLKKSMLIKMGRK